MSADLKQAFEQAAVQNYWSDSDSLSGPGSNMQQTRVIREKIPLLLEKYGITKILDAPCGDLFWMKEILPLLKEKGIQYEGADIVSGLIEKHWISFESYQVVFHTIDIIKEPIPKVDLVFTRDCFIHLSYSNIYAVLRNYRKSGAQYLLVSTYTNPGRINHNVDGLYLYGRMLNMQKFPFYFGKPVDLIVEECTENDGINSDKSLGLWKLETINLFKMKVCIYISLVPYTFNKWYLNLMTFFKRLKNFIKRKIFN